jgi:cephalosporin hydroxylase
MNNTVNFNLQTICDGHHNVTYRGVKAIRCPFDYVLYQMVISKVKPDLIIEVGTNAGGGSLYFSDLQQLNGGGVVHTMDVTDMVTDELVIKNPNIIRFLGGFQSYDLKNTEGFNNILVIDDGSHTYEDVKDSLIKFNKIVSKNSYFVVEDGILTELGYSGYNGGPLRAIEEFLNKNNEFVIDTEICNLFGSNATFNVNGFLKKKNG